MIQDVRRVTHAGGGWVVDKVGAAGYIKIRKEEQPCLLQSYPPLISIKTGD
jgi:hypothetical protein